MLEKRLKKKIRDYCDAAYPVKLDVRQEDRFRPLFNNRCHWNADAMVRQGDAVAVVECLILDADEATLHYVSLGKDLRAFDATLGPIYVGSDYRLIEAFRGFGDTRPDARLLATKRRLALAAGIPAWLLKVYAPDTLL